VLESSETKARVDWYDEIKTPLLTSLLLLDKDGSARLHDRESELKQVALSKCFTVDEQQAITTIQENFMQEATKN
jgi:hypothetical protein